VRRRVGANHELVHEVRETSAEPDGVRDPGCVLGIPGLIERERENRSPGKHHGCDRSRCRASERGPAQQPDCLGGDEEDCEVMGRERETRAKRPPGQGLACISFSCPP
jgi:hypothetical protein